MLFQKYFLFNFFQLFCLYANAPYNTRTLDFFFFNFEGTESINMAVDFFKIVRKRLFFYKNMALFFFNSIRKSLKIIFEICMPLFDRFHFCLIFHFIFRSYNCTYVRKHDTLQVRRHHIICAVGWYSYVMLFSFSWIYFVYAKSTQQMCNSEDEKNYNEPPNKKSELC